jgi:uncharacterized protein
MILDDLLANLQDDAPVRAVVAGAHLTVVCSRRTGLASTLADRNPHERLPLKDVGRLHLKRARELAEYARSENPLEASLGVAAINSLLDVDEHRMHDLNAATLLAERGRGRNVAIVGHFPFVSRLRDSVGTLSVIEQVPSEGDLPAEAAVDLLPRADVVGITGSALVNHTLDGLLALCRPGTFVVVLGPSTPFSPVLFDRGVAALAGAYVADEEAALRTAAQGASFQQVEGVRRLTWIGGWGGPVAGRGAGR